VIKRYQCNRRNGDIEDLLVGKRSEKLNKLSFHFIISSIPKQQLYMFICLYVYIFFSIMERIPSEFISPGWN